MWQRALFAILSRPGSGQFSPLLRFRLQSISIKKEQRPPLLFFRVPWFRLAAGPTLPGTFFTFFVRPPPLGKALLLASLSKKQLSCGASFPSLCAPV